MRKMIIGGIAVLAVVAMTTMNINLCRQSDKVLGISLTDIEALADDSESCPDDEKESSSTQTDCEDGGNCECKLCIMGNTDCTPTCPCCSK